MSGVRKNITLKLKQPPPQSVPSLKKHRGRHSSDGSDDRSPDRNDSSGSDAPPEFVTSGPPSPIHCGRKLKWDYEGCLIGEKVTDPLIHCCETCGLPILNYGRLPNCRHIFCLDCAQKAYKAQDPPVCPRCGERIERVETCKLGSVFVCSFGGQKHGTNGCRRSYLSQRDLQAHVEHRHTRKPEIRKQMVSHPPPGQPVNAPNIPPSHSQQLPMSQLAPQQHPSSQAVSLPSRLQQTSLGHPLPIMSSQSPLVSAVTSVPAGANVIYTRSPIVSVVGNQQIPSNIHQIPLLSHQQLPPRVLNPTAVPANQNQLQVNQQSQQPPPPQQPGVPSTAPQIQMQPPQQQPCLPLRGPMVPPQQRPPPGMHPGLPPYGGAPGRPPHIIRGPPPPPGHPMSWPHGGPPRHGPRQFGHGQFR